MRRWFEVIVERKLAVPLSWVDGIARRRLNPAFFLERAFWTLEALYQVLYLSIYRVDFLEPMLEL